jgi:3-oxoadipate enol-lactonase
MATKDRIINVSPDTQIHISISGPEGRGPTFVFLHFWGGSSKTWFKVVEGVSIAKFQSISIDFRGWGASTGPSDPSKYGMDDLANDVEAVLQELQIEECILVGHSMGGKVAQVLAGRKTIVGLKAVVLVATAPPGPLILPKEARDQQEHACESAGSAEFVTRNVLTANELSKTDVGNLVEDMTNGSDEAKAAWPAYGMAEDVREMTSKIDVPILVIGAAKDQVETIERLRSEVLPQMKCAQVEVILDCGHLIPVEAPQILIDYLSTFCRKIFTEKGL